MNRILVVDDNPENLYLLRTLLQGHGYKVDEARHGEEALTKARQSPPRIVISDLLMPVMDGYTLLRQWKADARLKQIPFIVYSATYSDPEDKKLAIDLGADAFIDKPAEPDLFIRQIQKTIPQVTRQPVVPPVPEGTPARLPVSAPEEQEMIELRQYNAVLIHKLEQKLEQLAQTNRKLEQQIATGEKTQIALTSSETMLRGIFESGPECVMLLSPDGSLHQMNPAGLAVIEANLFSQVSGESFYPLVVQEYRAQFQELTARVFRGESGTFEFQITSLKNTRRWLEIHATPLRDAGNKIVFLLGITRNITEQKQTAQKIRAQLDELIRWQKVTLGREDRVMELKREINELSERLGEPARYPSQVAAPRPEQP